MMNYKIEVDIIYSSYAFIDINASCFSLCPPFNLCYIGTRDVNGISINKMFSIDYQKRNCFFVDCLKLTLEYVL